MFKCPPNHWHPPTSYERNFCNFLSRRREMLPEMEFLDIILTKDSSLLLYDIHSPFYRRILKKTILLSGFKNPDKKSAKQENSSLFM
jgi:hypothetical protein